MPLHTLPSVAEGATQHLCPKRRANNSRCGAGRRNAVGPEYLPLVAIIEYYFAEAHARGLATIRFCYLHPRALAQGGHYIIFAADLTGEANHQGLTIESDSVKQKQPLRPHGISALQPGYCRMDGRVYAEQSTGHPIDLTRYQVLLS